jgi:hypothetical protein
MIEGVFVQFGFPIGTIIANYTFWVLTMPAASQLLGAAI